MAIGMQSGLVTLHNTKTEETHRIQKSAPAWCLTFIHNVVPTKGSASSAADDEMIVIGVLAGLIGVGVVAFVVLYVQRNKVQQRPNPMHPMVIEMGTVAGPFDGMIPVATAAVDVSALSSSSDLNVPPVAFVFDAVQGGAQKSNVDFGAAQRRRFSLYYDDKHGK